MSLPELEEWIIQKVQEHFDEAHEGNEKIFHTLDIDKNGKCFHVPKLRLSLNHLGYVGRLYCRAIYPSFWF